MNRPNEPALERIGRKVALIILLICLFLMIAWALYRIFTLTPENRSQFLPIEQEIKIQRYCQERRIHPEVIEIETNGRMFYMMDGKRCEIK